MIVTIHYIQMVHHDAQIDTNKTAQKLYVFTCLIYSTHGQVNNIQQAVSQCMAPFPWDIVQLLLHFHTFYSVQLLNSSGTLSKWCHILQCLHPKIRQETTIIHNWLFWECLGKEKYNYSYISCKHQILTPHKIIQHAFIW